MKESLLLLWVYWCSFCCSILKGVSPIPPTVNITLQCFHHTYQNSNPDRQCSWCLGPYFGFCFPWPLSCIRFLEFLRHPSNSQTMPHFPHFIFQALHAGISRGTIFCDPHRKPTFPVVMIAHSGVGLFSAPSLGSWFCVPPKFFCSFRQRTKRQTVGLPPDRFLLLCVIALRSLQYAKQNKHKIYQSVTLSLNFKVRGKLIQGHQKTVQTTFGSLFAKRESESMKNFLPFFPKSFSASVRSFWNGFVLLWVVGNLFKFVLCPACPIEEKRPLTTSSAKPPFRAHNWSNPSVGVGSLVEIGSFVFKAKLITSRLFSKSNNGCSLGSLQ